MLFVAIDSSSCELELLPSRSTELNLLLSPSEEAEPLIESVLPRLEADACFYEDGSTTSSAICTLISLGSAAGEKSG